MLVALVLTILLTLALCAYALLYKGRFVGRYHSSISIPVEDIHLQLKNLQNWECWLPWLIYDNSATFTYNNTASEQNTLVWQGELIKKGQITLNNARKNTTYFHTLLNASAFYPCCLHFNIDLSKQEKSTAISIQITGKLSFFRRWKEKNYSLRASKDAELALLNLLSDLSKKHSLITPNYHTPSFQYLDKTQLKTIDAVTRPFDVSNRPMSQKMEQGFHDLSTQLGPDNPPAGPSFALYKKADIIHHYFSGRLGVPVQNIVPCQLCPERITFKGKYIHLRYQGSYQHLSLAWHVLYNYMRLHHINFHQRRQGVEIFEVSPAQVSHNKDLVTLVYLPIR